MKQTKRILLLFGFIVLMVSTSCEKQDPIKDTSRQFLEGYYSYNFKDIYDISSPETLSKIKDIESRMGGLVDLGNIETPRIEIHEYYVDGQYAYCRYTLKQDKDDTSAMSENLKLVKKDDKWLVLY